MANHISLNDMIEQIRAWQRETDNFRDDSWTQDAYKEKIRELFDTMAPIVNNIDSRQRSEKYEQTENGEEEKS